MRIRLQNVSLHYGDHLDVLKDFSFEDEVTSLAIIGRSGCGKSTLLRVLGGLLVPQSGVVEVGGRRLSADEKGLLAHRRQIGYVFQQGGLFMHLSALDNIAIPLEKVHGQTRMEARHTAEDLLERFGLKDHGHKLPRELSGGQYQRIAIARAIASKPQLLLLDEPTSALDPEYTNEVLGMIDELKQLDVRFIIVTHEMGFARKSCEKVMMMQDGGIVEYGISQQLLSKPETSAMRNFVADVIHWA